MTFVVGDHVRLHTGKACQIITHIDTHRGVMSTVYTKPNPHNGVTPRCYDRRISDFTPFHNPENEEPQMAKLYKVKGTEKYGEFLTKDSENQMVLKMSDGGDFKGFKEEELEKVCPYTIKINLGGTSGHYRVPKDHKLKEGDAVIYSNHFGFVVKLDTQVENAKELKGLRKILTEEVV